jgi:hypothetical protein
MLFQRISRSDPETVFSIFYNVAGATITANYPAVWDVTSPDGVKVSKPATATLSLLVGVATENIADSAYGKFQVYGYRASAYMTNETNAGAAGDILIPVNAQWYLKRTGASDGLTGFVYAAETVSTAVTTLVAAANHKVFIRCL